MNKLKDYGLTWWITETIGLAIFVSVVVFEISINYTLYINNTISINQKIVSIIGVVMICLGWGFITNEIAQRLRKYIKNLTK